MENNSNLDQELNNHEEYKAQTEISEETLNDIPSVHPSVRPPYVHFMLVLFGVFGLVSLGFGISSMLKIMDVRDPLYSNLSNLLIYVFLLGGFALILWAFKLLKAIALEFTRLKPYLYGLFYGLIVILASAAYGLLTMLLFTDSTSNENQTAIEAIIKGFPVTSFIWIVIAGPLVEELIYRLGLFEGLRQKNRILAYVISGIIFGFIHFSVPLDASGAVDHAKLANEFINIPGYIISGLLFAYTYEKIGFAGSSVAHVTNNLISFILTIIRIYAEI